MLNGCLTILTLFGNDWIEALTGFDLDAHSGSSERAIVAGLAVISIVVAIAARAKWRAAATVATLHVRTLS